MKADLPKREPEILKRWQTLRLYEQIQEARQTSSKTFILHDGPPYANGDIHIGHALNKILKDLIVRYKTMQGYRAPYVPGWDCHGMPIEHQLFKELGITKQQIVQVEFRHKAKAYAKRFVEIQREQFKRLGVLGDWDHPYLTMDRTYELVIIRMFKELLQAGYIYYGKKPVYWCATCETALAEAEVEYENRQDPSIYVKLEIAPELRGRLMTGATGEYKDLEPVPDLLKRRVYFVIWTTTPWTLPANVAVALHPAHEYRFVEVGADEVWVIAEPLMERVRSVTRAKVNPTGTLAKVGKLFEGIEYARPLTSARGVTVTDESVSMEEGTGIVHIAPGHGEEDYLIGKRYGLEVFSPVDEQGRFTKDVPQWAGQSVWDANPKIIEELKRRGLLIYEETVTHSYPHCWRCKQPVIFRATAQWFLGVDHQSLRDRLLAAIKQVRWIPEAGLVRIQGMLEHRPDWCLSRQRYWGTPIPVLHCQTCEEPIRDVAVLERIERLLAERGTDFWFTASPNELAPNAKCPSCAGSKLRKEVDILDVWFDSGVSHEAVLKSRSDLAWPASLYVEGSDQHRGWFQVSLIPAMALRGRPPYEQVLTHGFVVDGEGRKMSKSLGNVIAPQEVIERHGAEILRLWVASCDYREDVRISEAILEHVAEAYRKIRNTIRYLLANVSDFNPKRDTQPIASCPEIDRWALQRTQRLLEEVMQAYESYQFHQAFRAIYQFCVLDLSAFYLDALKDRLYTEAPETPKRRCAQTALYGILKTLLRMLAPMLPITTEEVWQLMRNSKLVDEPSVHLASWPTRLIPQVDGELNRRWEMFLSIRDLVMKALEEQRTANVIGSPLEARVTLVVTDERLTHLLEEYRQTLAEAFIISDLCVENTRGIASGLDVKVLVPGLAQVEVERAPGSKCQRCWKYSPAVGTDRQHSQLCERCVAVLLRKTA